VSEDECATAADIYDCGVEKVPKVTKSMVTDRKGNNTVVSLLIS